MFACFSFFGSFWIRPDRLRLFGRMPEKIPIVWQGNRDSKSEDVRKCNAGPGPGNLALFHSLASYMHHLLAQRRGPCLERQPRCRFTPPSPGCAVPEWESIMLPIAFRPSPRLGPGSSEALPPPGAPPRSATRGRARSPSPCSAVGRGRPIRNRLQAWCCSPFSNPAAPARSGGEGLDEQADPYVLPPSPQERSLQALQRLQQVRVRLRPPLQVAQQLRGREELPLPTAGPRLFLHSVASALLGVLLLVLVATYVFVEFFINPMRLRTNRHFEVCLCVAVLKNHTDVWFVFLPAAPVETQAPAILALAAVLILLGLLSTALLGHLLCFHIYLIWHKLTTYEYIVQHRPPQEAKGAHRELKSCPPKMRPIQEMEFYMRTFSHVRPEPPGQARPVAVSANPSRFLATLGQVDPPPPSSPETLALPPRIRPQKKRKRRAYKVPTSGTLDREPPLPRLPGPQALGRRSSSSSDSAGASPVHAAGPAGAYHSASAESMDEIPVAQTRLGSAALAAPGCRGREPGPALQARAPAVFVSPSSGKPGARGSPEAGLA
ncbi:palmitoyltransferase ZDHHC1 isoform X3 [Equus przewalskii]|uniref:Palmitoyltransferase ZDHHC1 isoform X3 n=1 Tax=Equus przewalskii TaxID=9798 RepID=A0ABM4NTG8_EQUPR